MPTPLSTQTCPPAFKGRVGLSRGDITPPIGIYSRNWGAAAHDAAEGVHRPLTATVLAIEEAALDGNAPLVLIDLDLGWWRDRSEPDTLRRHICQTHNLPDANLLLALTHTHSGPVLSRDCGHLPGGRLIEPWLEMLYAACSELVGKALGNLAPAHITWGKGSCDLATERDYPDEAGQRYLCGFNPNAKADNTLVIARITGEKGEVRALLLNYACHPTILGPNNKLISPDYIGATRAIVEQTTGGLCLFMLGACGELAPARQYVSDTAAADQFGNALGHAALSIALNMPPVGHELVFKGSVESGAPLALWDWASFSVSDTLSAVRLDVDFPLKSDLPKKQEIKASLAQGSGKDPYALERLRRLLGVRNMFGDEAASTESIWIWKVGTGLLIATPFEAYSHFQTSLRERMGAHTMVGNVVNGWRGYLPPASHYIRNQYSSNQTPFAKGGLELLIKQTMSHLFENSGF